MASHLVKYAKGLVGQYYQTEGNTKLVVWLAGAPGLPSKADSDAGLLAQMGYDFIRPDYYGYARSDGFFSTKNCIQTAYDTIQTFRQMMPLFSIYARAEVDYPLYDEIVVVGASYGGWVAAMMPKFDPLIKEVVALYPWLGYEDMDMIGYPEESHERFLAELLLGYKHIYRFTPDMDPYDAMLDIGQFDVTKEMNHLTDVKVFVAHGNADTVIWSGRSAVFVQQLLDFNPAGEYTYVEYYGLGHGDCKESALKGRNYWRKSGSKTVE